MRNPSPARARSACPVPMLPPPRRQPRAPAITMPAPQGGVQPLGPVDLSLFDAPVIDAFAGVGFEKNPVATVLGSYNHQPDASTGDYHAQVNWGDSPQWDANTFLTTDNG